MRAPVVIVGAGLAGLVAARMLHRAGIDFALLEARGRLGGRIFSVDASGEPSFDGFDLGPSWYWPGMQPVMAELVRELGLAFFPQNSEGDVIFQRMSREAPQRYRGMQQEPQSMRIASGTATVISAIAAGLPSASIRLNARVTRVALDGHQVEVGFIGESEEGQSVRALHVIFALPPRLLEATVSFSPALDPAVTRRWRDTPTWMAPHAKVFALYDRPFWRAAGLSGTAQSMAGPLVEIHDATTASGHAALFGFVGVPAEQRAAVGRHALVAASIRQLASLFGPEAANPTGTLFKDWASDPLTATAADQIAASHPEIDLRPWVRGEWRRYISLAGSETSLSEPGFLAGAVEAATRTVKELPVKAGEVGANLRTSAGS